MGMVDQDGVVADDGAVDSKDISSPKLLFNVKFVLLVSFSLFSAYSNVLFIIDCTVPCSQMIATRMRRNMPVHPGSGSHVYSPWWVGWTSDAGNRTNL